MPGGRDDFSLHVTAAGAGGGLGAFGGAGSFLGNHPGAEVVAQRFLIPDLRVTAAVAGPGFLAFGGAIGCRGQRPVTPAVPQRGQQLPFAVLFGAQIACTDAISLSCAAGATRVE